MAAIVVNENDAPNVGVDLLSVLDGPRLNRRVVVTIRPGA